MTSPTTPPRVPLLPVDEAKAAADEAGVPDYMAELSIFQVLLNHPRLARTFNDMLATMLWHGALTPGCANWASFRSACPPNAAKKRTSTGRGPPAPGVLPHSRSGGRG